MRLCPSKINECVWVVGQQKLDACGKKRCTWSQHRKQSTLFLPCSELSSRCSRRQTTQSAFSLLYHILWVASFAGNWFEATSWSSSWANTPSPKEYATSFPSGSRSLHQDSHRSELLYCAVHSVASLNFLNNIVKGQHILNTFKVSFLMI